MDNEFLNIVLILVVIIILFLVLREVNLWYWKIDEKINQTHRTNFLLEKISMQLGATTIDEITIEEIATGKRKRIKIDTWIEYKMKNPKAKGFRTVKDEVDSEVK